MRRRFAFLVLSASVCLQASTCSVSATQSTATSPGGQPILPFNLFGGGGGGGGGGYGGDPLLRVPVQLNPSALFSGATGEISVSAP